MKKYNIIISILSLLGFLLGFFFLCQADINSVCRSNFSYIAFPVWGVSLSVFIVSLFLFFVRQEIFKSWLYFFSLFIPLSILLISIAPEYTADIITPFTKQITTWWMASIFFLISLLIIGIKSWKLRKR